MKKPKVFKYYGNRYADVNLKAQYPFEFTLYNCKTIHSLEFAKRLHNFLGRAIKYVEHKK